MYAWYSNMMYVYYICIWNERLCDIVEGAVLFSVRLFSVHRVDRRGPCLEAQ